MALDIGCTPRTSLPTPTAEGMIKGLLNLQPPEFRVS